MTIQDQKIMNKENRREFFEWKFEDFTHLLSGYRFSSKFEFHAGVSHFLTSKFYDSFDVGAYCIFRLCGCPNPLKACDPCFYTMCLFNSEGIKCFATKGKLEKCSKTVLMAVTENSLRENCHKGSVTVRLSWFNDKDLCEKGNQTEPVNSLQSTTRSKLSQLSLIKDMDNAVNSSDGSQSTTRSKLSQLSLIKDIGNTVSYADGLQSIQTDISHLSSIRDLDNAEKYPSLNEYIPCIFSPRFLEASSSGHADLSESKADTYFGLQEGKMCFPVHRVILSPFSAVYFAVYYLETMDINSGEVNIPDTEGNESSSALNNMSVGKLLGLTADTAVAMCEIADKHSLTQIKHTCTKFLIDNLTLDNICEAAVMADTQKEPVLRNKVVRFIGERLEELQETDRWKEFLNMNPLLASKLLSSALIANKKSKKKVSFK